MPRRLGWQGILHGKVRGKVNKPPSVEASLTATAISVDDPPGNIPGPSSPGQGANRAGLALQKKRAPAFDDPWQSGGAFSFPPLNTRAECSCCKLPKRLGTNKMWYFLLYTISNISTSLVVSSR